MHQLAPPVGASLYPKKRRQEGSDSGVSAVVWGGITDPLTSGPPTVRPYAAISPGETGRTGVYPPLCGEEL